MCIYIYILRPVSCVCLFVCFGLVWYCFSNGWFSLVCPILSLSFVPFSLSRLSHSLSLSFVPFSLSLSFVPFSLSLVCPILSLSRLSHSLSLSLSWFFFVHTRSFSPPPPPPPPPLFVFFSLLVFFPFYLLYPLSLSLRIK